MSTAVSPTSRLAAGRLLAVCLVVIFTAAWLASQVQTSYGRVRVTEIRLPTHDGQWIVADLFRPRSATAEKPAPLVVVVPGFQRSKETQTNIALELARRGLVAIAIDPYAQGSSSSSQNPRSATNEGYGMFAVVNYAANTDNLNYIDRTRIGVTGHSAGGNAAWDLGLAHPDLWAGVIPIVAESEQYCSRYWQNAKLVPFYVLQGEMDGDKVKSNAMDLDRYITGRFDITVVEYRGRGHEDFHDDIQNLFDWMNRRASRNFFPKEFSVATMRSWDNYFWWFEAESFNSRGIVDPAHWPPSRGVQPVQVNGKVLATNGVSVTSAGANVSVWLSPEVVDFDRPIKVSINGSSKSRRIEPDLLVLLEDVRTRADRQHAFWARFEP